MTVCVRPARPEDATCLSALASLVWLDTYATAGIRPALAHHVQASLSPQAFQAQLADASQHILLIEREGHVLAYAVLQDNAVCPGQPDWQAELATLYVMPRFARQGLGRQLLSACLRLACQQGQPGVWLSVYHDNPRALAFYRQLGLQQVGDCYFEMEQERHLNHVFLLAGNHAALQ
ncbi:MAG: GNAT family N-acetyltransferase [Aquitalea sp.]|nr:GNAT family N-acetyltransferase [Aquitalea sp.]